MSSKRDGISDKRLYEGLTAFLTLVASLLFSSISVSDPTRVCRGASRRLKRVIDHETRDKG